MPRLELVNVSKAYPGVRANDGVCLRVEPGEILAVLGENGAGKSTLMKIIYGSVPPDRGEMFWNGAPVHVKSPEDARRLGISMVFQHFSLFDTLTVAENVWLGLKQAPSLSEVAARVSKLSAAYGIEVDPTRPVHTLSVGEKQRVEIVRALLGEPKLLILDEPTSVLAPQAVRRLFEVLRRLASEGCSILYISHKLDEVRELCTRCTVLRAGRVTGDVDPSRETNASLSRLMIGAEPPKLEHREQNDGPVALDVKALSHAKQDEFGVTLSDVHLRLHAGEIVGVAGVSGNGQKELLALLSGEDPTAPPGSVLLFGLDVSDASPRLRRKLGLHFVPEERLGRAAVPSLSLSQNTLLTRGEPVVRGFVDRARLKRLAWHLIESFGVKASGPDAAAKSLSGGNLQKFIMAREIDAVPKVLIVSQPTWGVDIGAAAQIRAELLKLRDRGASVLVVSEELDELFELCDFLVVMAGGRVSPRTATKDTSVEQIGAFMSGLFPRRSEEVASAEARAAS